MNRKEDTVFCYYVHNSEWTYELGYGADTMFHRTYFLLLLKLSSAFAHRPNTRPKLVFVGGRHQ